MPALTACPEGNEPWSTENSGPNSPFARSSAGRGRSTRFFVSCETTMLPASSAVRKNSAERQRRITNSHAGMSRIVSTAPGISPRYWKAIGTTQLTWSRPLAPTSRRHASSSGWVNGASTSWNTASAEQREQHEPDQAGDEQGARPRDRGAPVRAPDAAPPAGAVDAVAVAAGAPVASAITSPP